MKFLKLILAVALLLALVVTSQAQTSFNIYEQTTTTVLAAPKSVTTTANNAGVDLHGYVGVPLIMLVYTNTAGTTPTLDVKLQSSTDNATFADITGGAFTQAVTNGVLTMGISIPDVGRYVRVVDTIGGTSSPAFTRAVVLVGRKQYN